MDKLEEVEENLLIGYSRVKALVTLLLDDRTKLSFEATQKLALIAGLKLIKIRGIFVIIDGDRKTKMTLTEAYNYCIKRIL